MKQASIDCEGKDIGTGDLTECIKAKAVAVTIDINWEGSTRTIAFYTWLTAFDNDRVVIYLDFIRHNFPPLI